MKEALGKDRQAMKLFTKVMPVFKHYLCTLYGISKNYYRKSINKLIETGQGNRFSGDIC